MLQQLSYDPALTQKRLGDGFYEQSLIRDQVAQLTGSRYLSGFNSDESEYQGLMTNAVTVAKSMNLVPGIALTAAQVAQLTSDIVWLVQKTITLPDGTTTQALVPQVYVSVQPGDVNTSGALISANSINLNINGNLNNSGTIAGRTVLALNAINVNNLGGNITATDVNINASNDINNIGGTITGQDSLTASAGRDLNVESTTSTQTNSQGTTTNLNRVAGLYVSNADATLIATAGRDINLTAAQISNSGTNTNNTGGTLIQAGNNLNIGTINTGTQQTIVFNNRNNMTQTNTAQVGTSIQTNGDLALIAGQNLNVKAASIKSDNGSLTAIAGNNLSISTGQSSATALGNTSYGYGTTTSRATDNTQTSSSLSAGNNLTLQSGGDTHITSASLTAGNNLAITSIGNLTIDAAKDTSSLNYDYSAKNKRDLIKNNDETVIGSQLTAGNNITLNAQANNSQTSNTPNPTSNLTLNSTNLTSQNGLVSLNAANNVSIGSTDETHDHFEEHTSKGHGFLSSKSSLSIDQSQSSTAIGSTVSGDSVAINANQDIAVQGSNVVATNNLTLNAGQNISITSTQNTDSDTHIRETKKSGLMSSGGVGFSIGSQQLNTNQTSNSLTNTASTIGSTNGDVNINAGKAYTQNGSDVLAPTGNINITAQSVDINAAQNTTTQTSETKFKQTGLTVSLSNPVVSAVQTTQQMATAASQTSDPRMQALAAGTTALSINNAAKSIADNPSSLGGIDVSVSFGTSKSQSNSSETSSTAQGSTVSAGKDITITATGAAKESNLNVIGSTIQAGNNVTLKADNQINLLAAQNTDTQTSTNKSSSASIGMSVGSNGVAVTASMSKGKGNANGTDVSYTNTQIIAGNKTGDVAKLESGTDTNLIGATVQGNQVVANVGTTGQGNLNIQSLQDTSTYNSKQSSRGASISVPIGAGNYGGSLSGSNSKINSDYASVNEQSGIKAGDGGFQVNVNGNTNLTGAVIASTQTAIDNNKNSLTTQTLTTSDIQNKAEYTGEASSFSAGVGRNVDPQGNIKNTPSASAGYASQDGNASSITQSAISGGAINITDNTKQTANTGKDATTTVATLNRDVHIVNTTDENGNTTSTTVDSNGNSTANTVTAIFDAEKVTRELNAAVTITQAFSSVAPTAVAEYADSKVKELQDSDPEEAAKWDEGGVYRVALHTIVGGLSGNLEGALGAGVSSSTISTIGNQIMDLDIPDALKQALVMSTAAAIGNLVGGSAGAATALSEAANNFLFSINKKQLAKAEKACDANQGSDACDRKVLLQSRDDTLDELQEDYTDKTSQEDMRKMISQVGALYEDDFAQYGIDAESFLLTMGFIESSFDPTDNKGKYQGLYQFDDTLAIGETLGTYGIGNADATIRLDPVWSTAAAAQYALDRAKELTNKGVSVTPESLYLSHQQGVSGAAALINNPELSAVDALKITGKSEAAAEKAVLSNGGDLSMTASQFVELWNTKYQKKLSEMTK